MANLKAGTLIGGNLIWNSGNLPLEVSDNAQTLYFSGHEVYTEGHAPTPSEIGAVSKTGDTMSGDLFSSKSAWKIGLTGSDKPYVLMNTTNGDIVVRAGHGSGQGAVYLQPDSTDSNKGVKAFGNGLTGISKPYSLSPQDTKPESLTRKDYVDGQISTRVAKAGDTMSGVLKFSVSLSDIIQDASGNRLLHNGGYVVLGNSTKVTRIDGKTTSITLDEVNINVNKPIISEVSQSTAGNSLTRRDYVDTKVSKTGNESVYGTKTFRDYIDLANGAALRADFTDDEGSYRDTGEILKATAGNDGVLELGTSKAPLVIFSKSSPLLKIGSNSYQFYHEGHKPTPTEIGAVSKSGDTMTGDLKIQKVGAKITILDTDTEDGTHPTLEFNTNNSQGVSIIHKEHDGSIPGGGFSLRIQKADNNTQDIGAKLEVEGEIYELNGKRVYSEGHKPTPGEIDAYTKAETRSVAVTRTPTGIADGTDLFEYFKTAAGGFYKGGSNLINKPASDWSHGDYVLIDHGGSYRVVHAIGNTGKSYTIAFNPTGNSGWAANYSTLFKPTPSDVDALALTGGTMTGTINSTNANAFKYQGKTVFGGTNDTWLRLNPNNSFTSGIFCGSSRLRTDGEVWVRDYSGSSSGVRISGQPSDTSYGAQGSSAFGVKVNDSANAHWLITSDYSSNAIRSGIQVRSDSVGTMRFYTNRKSNYVEIGGGNVFVGSAQSSSGNALTRKDYVDGKFLPLTGGKLTGKLSLTENSGIEWRPVTSGNMARGVTYYNNSGTRLAFSGAQWTGSADNITNYFFGSYKDGDSPWTDTNASSWLSIAANGNIKTAGKRIYHEGFKPNANDVGAIAARSGDIRTQDWNTLTTAGSYSVSNASGANKPSVVGHPTVYNYGTLLVQNNGTTINQLYITDGNKIYIRDKYSSNAWGTWSPVASDESIAITTSVNLDDYSMGGTFNMYRGSGVTFTNAPSDFDYGTLQVIGRGRASGSFCTQILTKRSDGTQYIRARNDGGMAWTGWRTIAMSNSTINTLTCTDWIRTSGNTGWYNGTHGGGMYMVDSTWVRTSHGKRLHVDNTGTTDAIYAVGGIRSDRMFYNNYLFSGGYASIYNSYAPFFYEKSTTSSSEWHSFVKGRVSKPGQATWTWNFGAIVGGSGATSAQIIGCSSSSNMKYFSFRSDGSFDCSGNITAYSDERVKTDVKVIDNALDKVLKLRGVTYLRSDASKEHKDIRQCGVIAQELEKVLPEAVKIEKVTLQSGEEIEDFRTVAYGNVTSLLIEAIKDLNKKIESLEKQLNEK